jgi:hypothetical protein
MINLIKQNWKLICSGIGIGMSLVHFMDGRKFWGWLALLSGISLLIWAYFSRDKNVVKKPYAAPMDKSLN